MAKMRVTACGVGTLGPEGPRSHHDLIASRRPRPQPITPTLRMSPPWCRAGGTGATQTFRPLHSCQNGPAYSAC